MKKKPRIAGKFNATQYQYRYCTDCNKTYVPIKVWATANAFTVKQCYTLLKRKLLVGLKHKGRMYVAPNVADVRKEYEFC